LYIVVLNKSSVVLADSPVRSLLEFSVSLPFRLCFLLAHCFQRTCNLVSLIADCKDTAIFISVKKKMKNF